MNNIHIKRTISTGFRMRQVDRKAYHEYYIMKGFSQFQYI